MSGVGRILSSNLKKKKKKRERKIMSVTNGHRLRSTLSCNRSRRPSKPLVSKSQTVAKEFILSMQESAGCIYLSGERAFWSRNKRTRFDLLPPPSGGIPTLGPPRPQGGVVAVQSQEASLRGPGHHSRKLSKSANCAGVQRNPSLYPLIFQQQFA